MTAPQVSVLMPVLDEEHFVAAAVRSVLDQSIQDVEVLVVDGRSTDRTAAVVRELAARHPQVRLLDNPERTIPHGLNVGLRAARGEYVARVDAHARINDSYLARGVRTLRTDAAVAAVGGRRIGVARTPVGRAVAAALSSPFGVGNSINHYALAPQETDHASFGVYRRSVLEHVGGWDERLLVNEDVDIDHRILLAGHRIRYDPGMHIYWQVRESFADLAHQYRRYGRGKAAMVCKNGPAAVRVRHTAAPALVASLAGGALLAARGRPWPLAAVTATYGAGLAAAVHRTAAAPDDVAPVQPVVLGGAFAVMHLSWGWGFFEGLLARRPPARSSAG